MTADAFTGRDYSEVFLATGKDFPDALALGPAAGRRGAPVLLVDGKRESIDQGTAATLARLDADQVVLLGLEPSISDGIGVDLVERGLADDLRRIGGENRYDTSGQINAFYDGGALATSAFLASGDGFADALSARTVAAAMGAPIVLSRPSCDPQQAVTALAVKYRCSRPPPGQLTHPLGRGRSSDALLEPALQATPSGSVTRQPVPVVAGRRGGATPF